QPRERCEQGRLACAVGANHRDQLPASRVQTCVLDDGAATAADDDIGGGDLGHGEVFRRRTTSQKKNGVPSSAVNTPSFISGPKRISRVAMSAPSSNTAPA